MTLVDELKKETHGEIEATKSYRNLAIRLRDAGHHSEGNMVDGIADDEDRHANLLMTLTNSVLSEHGFEKKEYHYWEVHNNVTGEILQKATPFKTIVGAAIDARRTVDTQFEEFGDASLAIKVYNEEPDQRSGLAQPEYTESYRVGSPFRQSVEKTLDRISQPLTLKEDRTVPKTYGDWVSLGSDIKEKAGIDDFGTTTQVNTALQHIYDEGEKAEQSKRWLIEKAGELGIT